MNFKKLLNNSMKNYLYIINFFLINIHEECSKLFFCVPMSCSIWLKELRTQTFPQNHFSDILQQEVIYSVTPFQMFFCKKKYKRNVKLMACHLGKQQSSFLSLNGCRYFMCRFLIPITCIKLPSVVIGHGRQNESQSKQNSIDISILWYNVWLFTVKKGNIR